MSIKEEIINRTYKKKNKTLYDQIIDGSYKSKINQELEKNESESQNINLPNNSAQAKTTAISLPINKTVSNLPIVKDLNNTKMAQENNLPILPVNTQPQQTSRTVTDVAKEFLDTTGKSAKTILTGINYLGQGIMKGTEGLTDTAIDVATSNVNPYYWFNQEKLENHQNIAQELIKKDATGDLITKLSGDEDFNKNFLDKDSLIKEDNLAGKVITSVGQMLPSIATGNPTAATTILGLQSYGGGVEEAYNNGANTTQARLYGLGNAAIELGTEKLFGGIPGTKTSGWLDNLVARGLGEKSFEEVSKSISKEIIKAGYKMVGEAGEEALAEIINPILKNATYSEGEKINWNNVLESAVVGGITGGILEAPSNIRNVNTAINNKNKVNLSTVDSTTSQNVNLPPVNNVETNLSSMKNENINLPTVKYRPETSDNSKINNLRQSAANYFDNSQKTHDLVSTIEKVIADKDYNVVFDNTITNKKGESVNAQITNNNGQIEIKINPNSPRTCEFLLCHEITHAIEINSMKQLVIDYASKHSDFNESLESLKQSYGTNEVTDEVLADISGQLFGNQEFINNLSMKQPNVFKRIYNKIVELANKITGNSKESLFIKDLKNKWETAYRNTSLEESVNNLNDSTKYMMTSVKGMQNGLNTNNRYQDIKNKYDRAIQLESSGQYDNEAIRQETGWFKDKEGNWEFEISDQYTKFKIQPKDNTKYKLSDIFEANTLYEMYPELKDITVSFKDMKGNGKYFAVTNGISINNKLINNLDSMRGTLLHEIQHYIQKVEGLPEGTTLFFGNEQYANSKGEIEAADTKNRRNLTVEQRKSIIPESSKENPIHPNRQSILNHKRNFVEKIGDKIYNKFGDNSNEISEEFYQENQKENIEIDSSSNRNGLEELDNSSFSVNKNGELQDNEGKKVKLETSETGTHGTLMAIHNLSTEKLRGILELGGFPVPSIAITNPDKVNHKQFGEISVLFDKNTINPSDKLNEVYDRDVWSPTFPTIDSEINKENLESVADEIGIKDYYLEDIAERNSNIEDLIYQVKKHDEVVRKFLDNNNIKYDADIDTYKELRNLATDNGLDTYLRKQLSNILGEKGIYNGKEYLTPSGNRRTFWQLHDKYTLENLVKNLTKGKTTGTQQVLFGAGFGPTSANMNNQFKSIEDIKNAENRIVSSEEQQKQQIGYIANLENAMKPLRQYAVEGIYTSGSEQVYNVIQELSEQKKVNVTNLIKILSEHGFSNVDTISQETLQNVITSLNDLKNMPTDYFEAKPQRAVGLNEVQAIIIPNTTDTEFKRQLQEFGLNYYEYDSNIEGDRQRVINQFDNLKFSQQNDKWQEYVEENYKATGTRTKFEDIKIPIAKENKINLPPVQTTNEVVKNDTKNNSPILRGDPTKESTYESESRKTRKEVQNELIDEMQITAEDLSTGNDIKHFDMLRTDPIRLNEKVFGAKIGKKINDVTINKTKHNEAERIRFLNKERSDIEILGIKARSKESAAVQKYGEKKYTTDDGRVIKYGDYELARDFPNVETQKKIKKAASILRNKYDAYIDEINSVITNMGYDAIPKRTDYMRHFHEISDKLSQWGIPLNHDSLSADTLPTDINGVTDQFKPGKNWFASTMHRTGVKTTYDAITGIDGYLEGASNLIYHTEDIQRYRALSKMIRETYGQIKGFENLDGLTDTQIQQRIKDIQNNKLSNYVAWLDEQANALAGKKGGIDRAAERLLGRKIYTILDTAKKQVGSNMTGFNVRSALTNFASSVMGASKTNKLAFIRGTISTMQNIIHNDGLINKSDFLTSRFGSKQLSKKLWQKASSAGQIFMTGSDYFTANQIWRSKYFENLYKGMNETEAIKNADDFSSRIMGDRSKGATAEIFNSKTLGLLTQFQLEVNNQWSSIIHDNKIDIQGKNKSGTAVVFQLGQLAAMSYMFNNLMKSLTGSGVMIDPIDLLMKMFDDDDEKTTEEKATEVIGEIVNNIPFASVFTGGRIPISEAFTGAGTFIKKMTNQTDSYGNEIKWEDVKDDLISSAFYWLLPTGYGQIKKTSKGLSMYDKNLPIAGSYTDSGNLRFTADESTGGKIKAALFGQYSSTEAQKYIDGGYKTINKNRITEMKQLNMSSSEYRDYRNGLTEAGTTNEDKIDYIVNLKNVTNQQKNIMASNLLSRDFDVKEYDKYNSYDEYNYAYQYPEKYSIITQITDYDSYNKYNEKLKDIRANTTNDKIETIKYINSLRLSIPQKAMYIKMYYSSYTAYDKQIVEYINKQKMTINEKKTILQNLGFKFNGNKVIY